MTYRVLIQMLQAAGWRHVRTTGSHLHFRHPNRGDVVTVPGGGKMSKEVAPGTLRAIMRQAGLRN